MYATHEIWFGSSKNNNFYSVPYSFFENILMFCYNLFVLVYSACKGNEFMCGNKKCIPDHFVCDEEDDCLDFSDEKESMCSMCYIALNTAL
jgi:hypothetical protein